MEIKFSFDLAATRLGMTKEQLQERLEKLSIYEVSGDSPCPKFYLDEGHFITVEGFDNDAGHYIKLFFTENGILAFEKLFKREVTYGKA